MNENLNLVEILKDCPKGTKLYSTIYGEVEYVGIDEEYEHPITFRTSKGVTNGVTSDGTHFSGYDGECVLFPSKEQRDWSKFKPNKERFDPKTLKPFDKVLVRDDCESEWQCDLFSHINYELEVFPYKCTGCSYRYCIPYNEETKHLIGTTEEAPEFYRYWDD